MKNNFWIMLASDVTVKATELMAFCYMMDCADVWRPAMWQNATKCNV